MAQNSNHISYTSTIGPQCLERFLPLRLPEAAQLRDRGVSMGGISDLQPPYAMQRKRVWYHVLLCTTEGGGVWVSGRKQGEMLPDSVWLFPAGHNHRYRIAGPTWRMHWFHLNSAAGWDLDTPHPTLLGPILPGLQAAMQGLITEEHSAHADTSQLRRQYSELILSLLTRLVGDSKDPPATSRDGRLTQLWQEVAGNPRHPWTVEELASRIHVSAAHLHRLTREHYNSTPMQRVTEQRMEVGRMLLRYTDYPLSIIADRTGYQTPYAFSRAFKRFSGVSPRDYRKQRAS